MKSIARAALDEKIEVSLGGKLRRLTRREALMRQQISKATQGDTKAFQLVASFDEATETVTVQDELTDDQKARVIAFLNPADEEG